MAERLDHLKKYYRARFCGQGGKKINIQPGQNVLKYIQDCFECDDTDVTISSPNAACSSTPLVRNQERTSTQSTRPDTGLNNVVGSGTRHSALSLLATPAETVRSKAGKPCVLYPEPRRKSCIAGSTKTNSPVPGGKTRVLTFEDEEGLCESPAKLSDPEDNYGVVGTPILVEEAKTSPVQTCTVSKAPSTPPPPVKDQDVEIESDCEFLIEESGCLSFKSWFSIPRKNNKSKKDGSATPILKSQSSEKEKTADKKCKNMKVQAQEHSEQKIKNVRVQRDLKRMPESHPISSGSERKVLKSQIQSSTRVGKSKKDALKGSSKHRKTSCESETEQLMLFGLDSEASDDEQKIRRVLPREDLPMPSAEHQQEQMLSPKKNLTPCKYQQSASKAYQRSVHKKQTKQKLANDKLLKSQGKKLKKSVKRNYNKNPEPQRWKSSDSALCEEGLEREPFESNEMLTSPPRQELQTSVLQKLTKSEKAEKVLHALESVTDVNNKTPLKAAELLQQLVDSMKNSENKRSSATSSGKIVKRIHHRAHKSVCSITRDSEPQNTTDSDSSSAQEVARKKHKQSAVKTSEKSKSNKHQRLQHSAAAGEAVGLESGLVLEHSEKYTPPRKPREENNESSDSSEDLHCQIKNLLSDEIGKQKIVFEGTQLYCCAQNNIVLPSNTPNVRRTKRIRLKPLEYWRGERLTYTLKPSGRLLISGIAGAEAEPHMKNKLKSHHKQKRAKTRSEVAECLDIPLGDASKPTSIVDPVTSQEVLLECINSGSSHSCFFEDESIKIYKSLNTSYFAVGKLILKPLKEKGHQFVHMDTIAFYVIRGKIIITLHKTSYYLTSGDYFYVPAGNGYNVRNLLDEESVLHFTQLKKDRTIAGSVLSEPSSP